MPLHVLLIDMALYSWSEDEIELQVSNTSVSASDMRSCHYFCHEHRQRSMLIERDKAELYVSNPSDPSHGGGGGEAHR
eukprot:1687256-Pleurochrysis_carterae.AAC.1